MINRFLCAGRRALWCLSVCAVSMGAAAQEPLGDEERDDDDFESVNGCITGEDASINWKLLLEFVRELDADEEGHISEIAKNMKKDPQNVD
mgnify:CR=1 FL=1